MSNSAARRSVGSAPSADADSYGPVNLRCPVCLASLVVRGSGMDCESCQRTFSIEQGVPVLRQNDDTYYGEFAQDEMKRLLDASRKDIESAITEFLRNHDAPPRLGEYILGHGRAGWQYLLPVDRESTVLDLGCGWGTLAWSLAQFCGQVVACDSTLERMQLLQVRKEREQKQNLHLVCAGDTKHLPFAEDSFDAVVINGVLEWVPSGLEGNPREVQVRFLKEVRRVLRSDGAVFLGIENRYAWKTWFRNRDGHTGLRFVPWLPRYLAHAYSRWHGKGTYRNYLYGARQYRKLLTECGFEDTRFYVPSPGYHHPVQITDFGDREGLRRSFSRPEVKPFDRFRQRIKGELSARFPDAFCMVSGKRDQPSYLNRLLSHIQSILSIDDFSPRFSYRMNGEMGIVTVIVRNATPLVVKIPLHARGLDELRREWAILEQVHENGHPLHDAHPFFARPMTAGQFGGQDYFVHSMLPGASGDQFPLTHDSYDELLANAASFLAMLSRKSPRISCSLSELVDPLRESVLTLAWNDQQRDQINRLADRILSRLEPHYRSAVWSHGDSKLANFMFHQASKELTGVIDWGTGLRPELPGYDLSFLIVSSEAKRQKISVAQQIQRQRQGQLSGLSRKVVEQFQSDADLPLTDESLCVVIDYQWFKRLAPLADGYEAKRYDHRYLDSMFQAILQ